jgi:hypothetical protein
MLHASSLRPDTRRVLERLSERPDVKGFTLIGGTALALRHGHRESEDIDLVWTEGDLPKATIRTIVEELPEQGPAQDYIPKLQKDLATNDGVYLGDHQQDWLVDGVKVTFYSPEDRNRTIVVDDTPEPFGHLAVASDEALFKMKSAVLLDRSASRDLFDLWYLCTTQSRTVGQILANMRQWDRHKTVDMHLARIAPGALQKLDPLFTTRMPGAPSDPEALLREMKELADLHRRHLAKQAALAAGLAGPGLRP